MLHCRSPSRFAYRQFDDALSLSKYAFMRIGLELCSVPE
jgi:hypothetical protein